MDGSLASPAPSHFRSSCAHYRTYLKDLRVHPYLRGYWPECLAFERMSRDQLLERQRAALLDLVNHAVEHVPFYRAWAKRSGYRPGDDLRLGDLPVVGKKDYIADIEAFQSDAFGRQEMRPTKTSGSSGEPFLFRTHDRSIDYSYACLLRALSRHGLRNGDRRVLIWGQSWRFSVGGLRRRLMPWKLRLRDWLNNTLYIDAYELTDANVERSIERIEAFEPEFIYGYVSSIYTVARALVDRGRSLRRARPRVVVTESEKLYDFQRQAMEQAFGCTVAEHYGSVELGAIAEADPAGQMRINEDLVVVERSGGGEAIITNLRTHAYPFIRYKLGDLIEVEPRVPPGLPYAVLRKVVGRTVDLIPLAGGGYVHGVALAHVIDPHLSHVVKYQIHQTALDRFVVRLVVRRELPAEQRERIVRDLRGLVGQQAQVEMQFPPQIDPAPSGKFRWVLSDVSDVARRALEEAGAS